MQKPNRTLLKKNITVSIIIPVYNDKERLTKCLKKLSEQNYPKSFHQVIVVDNGSFPPIKELVLKYGFTIVHESKPGSYAARNKGIKSASGEILGLTDSDCIPSKDWIKNAATYFSANSNNLIIGGKINVFDKTDNMALCHYDKTNHLDQKKMINDYNFAATANLFVRKHVFDEIGLFDDRFFSYGDVEFGKRATGKGIKIKYADDVCVYHPAINSVDSLCKRSKRLAGGIYYFHSFKKNFQKLDHLLFLIFFLCVTPFSMLKKILTFEKESNLFSYISLCFLDRFSKFCELFELLFDKSPQRK